MPASRSSGHEVYWFQSRTPSFTPRGYGCDALARLDRRSPAQLEPVSTRSRRSAPGVSSAAISARPAPPARPPLPPREPRGAPRRDGGIREIVVGIEEVDPRAAQRLYPKQQPLQRPLRREIAPDERAERDLGVHLEDPLVREHERLDLEDSMPEPVRLDRKTLPDRAAARLDGGL